MFTKANFIDNINKFCDSITAVRSPLKGAPDYFNLLFIRLCY